MLDAAKLAGFLILAASLDVGATAARAESDTTNTNITVKKGDDPEFTILSDTDEVAGEPFLADAQARESWKKACTEWKAEMREQNKGNQILAINCGTPKATPGENAATIYQSTGSYKIRVRVRSEPKGK